MILVSLIVPAPIPDAILSGLLLAIFGMCWVVLLVRANGLRSFSKMTNFDFVMTIAVGSLLAGLSQSTTLAGVVQSASALMALFVVQYVTARLRRSSELFERMIQNRPIVLARDGVFLDDALQHTRVARSDLVAKLREANVRDMASVRAVVLETTGDISVLHGPDLDAVLLSGTRRVKR